MVSHMFKKLSRIIATVTEDLNQNSRNETCNVRDTKYTG